jgi:hypothetical protein
MTIKQTKDIICVKVGPANLVLSEGQKLHSHVSASSSFQGFFAKWWQSIFFF